MQLADTTRKKTERHNELLQRGYIQDSFDPALPFVLPAEKPSVPFLNFAPLRNAVARLVKAGSEYKAAATAKLSGEAGASRSSLEEVNRILYRSERSLTLEKGLKGRPWFRHQVYAPGFYTGYGVKTLPGVRESIEQRDWEEADRQIGIVAEVLDAYTSQIERATRALGR